MIYKVSVQEVYRIVVEVDAPDEAAAHQRVSDAWNNTEFILDGDAFAGVEFHVMDEAEGESGMMIGVKGEVK